jgi:hypothetical protein
MTIALKKMTFGCLLCAGLAFSAPSQAATQLITNGGFETGDYSGWQLTGDESAGDGTPVGFHNGVAASGQSIDGEAPINAHSGNDYFYFGNAYSDATLTQSINTTAGQKYDFSFYVDVLPGATPNDLNVKFGNDTVYSGQNLTTNGWQLFNYQVAATGPTTTVSFGAYNNPTNNFLDDVSVIKAVPEASTMVTFAMLLAAGSLMLIRRRRQSARIE